MPVLGSSHALASKGFVVPALVTVCAVVGLFTAAGSPVRYMQLLAVYLGVAGYWTIFRLCGQQRPLWLAPAIATATVVLLVVLPPMGFFAFFRQVLPGTPAQ